MRNNADVGKLIDGTDIALALAGAVVGSAIIARRFPGVLLAVLGGMAIGGAILSLLALLGLAEKLKNRGGKCGSTTHHLR